MNGPPTGPGLTGCRPLRPSYAGGRYEPGLRIGTHNVCGFQGRSSHEHCPLPFSHTKLESLYRIWWLLYKLDIVFVQEHMVPQDGNHASHQSNLDLIAARLHGPSYLILSACSPTASGGVAILIRKDLIIDGIFSIIGGENNVIAAPDGRMIHMHASWAGHALHLVNVYLPSGDPQAQQDFIRTQLMALDCKGHDVILGGDMNFTMDWRRDRFLPLATSHPDAYTALVMTDFLDRNKLSKTSLFRHFHPTTKAFSRFDNQGSRSLIDGFFVSQSLLSHISRCRIENITLSDHRPVTLCLRPRSNADIGPGLYRTSLNFWNSPDLKEAFLVDLASLITAAPANDDQLLDWWPCFKITVLSLCKRFDREQYWRDISLSQEEQEGKTRLDAAMLELEEEEDASSRAERLRDVINARSHLKDVLASSSRVSHLRDKFQFIHHGESPSPFLSKILSVPQPARIIAGLSPSPGMGLVTRGPEMAELMIEHFADISSTKPSLSNQAEAETQVLQAIRAHAKQIDPNLATTAGRPTIDPSEVQDALSSSENVKAPGLDGLPPKLWKHGGPLIPPLLARLFSAIGKSGRKPIGFTDGVITPILKQGDRATRENYRPICLLGTDYRILSKVLAVRFEYILNLVIGPEQVAFLKSRLIGDNIHFFDLLPEALRSNARIGQGCPAAWVLFADFRKAYDTIRRLFLKKVMETVGAGPDLIRWVDILLSNTWTSCMVNGYVSLARLFEEGVRQGCPLACALYLFIAWGLHCWLKECPDLGIEPVPTMARTCSLHFADDSKALFARLFSLPRILSHFYTFGLASGQYLNHNKSTLMPFGDLDKLPGYSPNLKSACGIKVVRSQQSLGVTHFNSPPSDHDPVALHSWDDTISEVTAAYGRIIKADLSTFGRASAASSYGINKVLFRAEHSGIPTPILTRLESLTCSLVDKNMLLPSHLDTGIPQHLLYGKAKQGGFGKLPWKENIVGRHARAAQRFLSFLLDDHDSPFKPLWLPLATTLLSRLHPSIHPAFSFISPSLLLTFPPGPLHRWAAALAALGPLQDIDPSPLQLGPWCKEIPLLHNPLLPLPPSLPLLGSLTLGDVVSAFKFLCLLMLIALRAGQFEQWAPFGSWLQALCSIITRVHPVWWTTALRLSPSPLPPPSTFDLSSPAVSILLGRMGWPGVPLLRPIHQQNRDLQPLTVSSATSLLIRPHIAAQMLVRSTYISRALQLGLNQPTSLPNPSSLTSSLTKVWKLTWLNVHKEPLYRLSINAIAGRHLLHTCPCRGHNPANFPPSERALAWRDHHFWMCPIPQAIISALSAALPPSLNITLECQHLWLLSPPHPSIHDGVWSVIATAAIAAMDSARRYMIKLHLNRDPQRLITDFFRPSGTLLRPFVSHAPLARASRFAVYRFWALVRDFADLNPHIPSHWRALDKLPGHPFLSSIDGQTLVYEPP